MDKSEQAAKRILIPKLKSKVKIDGLLSEACWKNAAVIEPFLNSETAGPEREHTRVLIWYDTSALYLGWTCQDQDIQATFTNRDSKFWDEEVVEFFVTPSRLDKYFELQWNPLGGVFDAIIDNTLGPDNLSKAFKGDWSYTARGMKHKVLLRGTPNNSNDRDEFWQVEVKIPFANLGVPCPKPGDVWRGNFFRFNRTHDLPVEPLAWSPTLLPGFHEPSRFGYLVFGER
jgi:hypothetical protein